MATEIRLPDVGENIEKATVLKILVQTGDTISPDQALIEIETDKATLEVPSEVEGVIQSISVAEGDTVQPGQVLMIAGAEGEKPEEKPAAPETSSDAESAPGAREGEASDASPAESEETPTEVSEPPEAKSEPRQEASPKEDSGAEEKETPPPAPEPEVSAAAPTATIVPAAPSVRRLAREIGVDIQQVHGSGPGSRVTEEDVKRHAQRMRQGGAPTGGAAVPPIQLPDFSKWGPVRRESLPQIRKVISTRMTQSWTTIPHVHHFDSADITELERARKTHNQRLDPSDAPVTVTAALLRLVGALLKRHPALNATLDLEAGQVVYKDYYHVGLAVDTERGLLVPVVRDVDQKSVVELASEAAAVARKARNGQLTLEEMQGASFTITNIGGIGGGHFTPIINPPEVAILGVGRAVREPVVVDDHVEERLMLPLSLGYDHRLIDGAVAARFLTEVCRSLADPAEFLMWI